MRTTKEGRIGETFWAGYSCCRAHPDTTSFLTGRLRSLEHIDGTYQLVLVKTGETEPESFRWPYGLQIELNSRHDG